MRDHDLAFAKWFMTKYRRLPDCKDGEITSEGEREIHEAYVAGYEDCHAFLTAYYNQHQKEQ